MGTPGSTPRGESLFGRQQEMQEVREKEKDTAVENAAPESGSPSVQAVQAKPNEAPPAPGAPSATEADEAAAKDAALIQ